MSEEKDALIDRVSPLVSEQDAEALRAMARDFEELTAGVHKLAEKAMLALVDGNWPACVKELEKLREIA